MKKGTEVSDYLRVWQVKFSEKFSPHTFSERNVSARSVDEALRKARSIERQESGRVSLKVASATRGDVLDG